MKNPVRSNSSTRKVRSTRTRTVRVRPDSLSAANVREVLAFSKAARLKEGRMKCTVMDKTSLTPLTLTCVSALIAGLIPATTASRASMIVSGPFGSGGGCG